MRSAAACAGGAESGQSDTAGANTVGRRAGLGALGVQLYTVRGEMERDFDATLTRVAQIGYREVEFAGYFGRSPAEIRASLQSTGLAAPSTHVPLESLEQKWDETLEYAAAAGHQYIVVPWLSEDRRRTLDDYRRVAQLFNGFGARLQRAGFTFAYHNHDFEFAPLEGRLPFDVLLDDADSAVVKIELDLYWITKAGQSPLDYFARFPGRFPLVHVKDSAGPPDHRQVDVGSGTIDWARLLGARDQAGIRHIFVEHDDPADPFGSIAASHSYLSQLETS